MIAVRGIVNSDKVFYNKNTILEEFNPPLTMKRIVFILLTSLIYHPIVKSQSETIEIWQRNVPDSKPADNYNLIVDTSGDFWSTRHITHPTIDVFLTEKSKQPTSAVIICPGGGYWCLAYGHEGEDVAKWLNENGISAFVLKYRLPDEAIMENKAIAPLQDAQRAMRLVRQNAEKWNIAPDKIGVMGFSAGGHLASTLSTHYNDKVYEFQGNISARPDFSLLIYPVISMEEDITHLGSRNNLLGENPDGAMIEEYSNEKHVDSNTPPAFLVHSLDDNTVPVQNSINYVLSLKISGVPGELHIYQQGGHGYGLGRTDNTESNWPDACLRWLKEMSFCE